MIVALEGIDGIGKTTHARALADRMRAKLWKFPVKDSPTGKLIYAHLAREWAASDWNSYAGADLTKEEHVLNALLFQSLQLTNRMEVLPQIFRDAQVGNVVFDRYWQSGYAYGKADGLDGEYLIGLHSTLPPPNLNLLLDADAGHSFSRRTDRRDRYEEDAKKMNAVVNNYRELWYSKMAPGETLPQYRWRVINARGTLEETAAAIDAEVAAWRDSVE